MPSPKIMDTTVLHGDEYYTLREDAEIIADNLVDRPLRIWCPFRDSNSVWVDVLQSRGHSVVATDTDFFRTSVPNGVDAIVSNPPFSLKYEILVRIRDIGLHFALILPFLWLNDGVPFDFGNQLMLFRKRMFFNTPIGGKNKPRANCFVLSNGLLKRDFIVIRKECYGHDKR